MEQPPATYQVNGAAIRERRKDLGISIADLADRAGISRPYLNCLELGIKRHMRPPTYAALRTALGLDPRDPQLLDPSEDRPEKR